MNIYPPPYTYIAIANNDYYWIHAATDKGIIGTLIDEEKAAIPQTPNILWSQIQDIGIEGERDISNDTTLQTINYLRRVAQELMTQ